MAMHSGFDANHKTIFVLDHTPYFGISGDCVVDLDFVKCKVASAASLPTISKSLWTCAIEASVEYCRIVWDLFPTGKLVRFIVSDTAAHIVNTWSPLTQNIVHIMNAMSMVGVPPRAGSVSQDFSVIHGLRAAIEALAETTDLQKLHNAHLKTESIRQNRGRVICITSARDDASMKNLEDIFNTVILQQNKACQTNKELLNIDHCHLVIINLYPTNMESLVTNKPVQKVFSPLLTSEIHSVRASQIPNKLTHLTLPHYHLASTTVTGIPMKEEQNASSSANYDVEIFHCSRAHTVLKSSEIVLPKSIREGADYETVTLKWCTPRGCGASDMQQCLEQTRVTPVDVISRPSSCLINFLLNGRSVLLEMPRKLGGKLTSHLLSAHGGEIFIHTLSVVRSCLEDLPSISEGIGGRIFDYRIPDFGMLMRMHKLVPLKPIPERSMDVNLLKMRAKISKHSKYFPLTLRTTVLYNVRQFIEPILSMIGKEEITEEEVVQCQKIVYSIVNLESRQEPLHLPNMGHRLKGNKKEEQYRLIWTELEILVASSGNSPGHKSILNCIKECRSRGPDQAAKIELDQAVRDLDVLGSVTSANQRASVIHATTDSPMSPPSMTETSSSDNNKKKLLTSINQTVLDMVKSWERAPSKKRLDFSGRICTPTGQIAKLYPNLGSKEATIRETDSK